VHPPVTPAAKAAMEAYHREVLDQVKAAVAAHPVVVVGMAWNQPVKKVRRALDEAGIEHHYHEIGNYLGQWRERLAVKMWSGWPTFPQVFVRGTFVGGADLTIAALKDGSLRALRDAS
jgi:monothiol glutaredoxin